MEGGPFALIFSSPPQGIGQLKSPHPWEFAIQGKKNANTQGLPEGGWGGLRGWAQLTDALT